MDLLNGSGVSGGKQNGSVSKTLNVIAPDHPFWNQPEEEDMGKPHLAASA